MVVAWLVLFIAVAGTASAFWGASGSGSGSGTTGTTVSVRLSPGVPGGDLFPGGQADVLLTVTNPNSSPMRLGALILDPGQGAGGFSMDAAHSGCGAEALGFARQTNGGVGWTVPAGSGSVDGTLSITLPSALTMSLGAANACQGARVTVYLAVAP